MTQPTTKPASPAAPAAPFVHPTAIVDPSVVMGPGAKVWHFCHVMGNARIGAGTSVGQNCFIAKNVVIGERCKLQNNISVYECVTLEDEVFCGPSMVFTNVLNPRAFIERKNEYAPTLVKRGASLGANCTIVCGVTIGRYAFVGAGAVVTKDVPDYGLVVGVPAKRTGWVSRAGRVLGTDLTCPDTGEKYEVRGGVLVALGA
jgi:UDP-2-acetamido-3-amino-2,3-dideoxy-glucuronate N-acetyltransferase